MIEGSCRLALDGEEQVTLSAGDFVLLPATPGFVISRFEPVTPRWIDPKLAAIPSDEVRHDEAAARRAGRDLVLARLVEVLLIEALRATPPAGAPPGLLRGLAYPRLAVAIRRMHGETARDWTVAELAKDAGLSRSAFFDRFTRALGLRPMEYLMVWRMAVEKDLLRHHGAGLEDVARQVGYSSASTFSTAFSRHVGQPPGRYARAASA